jgi:methionine-rich copper-binding protein CopC
MAAFVGVFTALVVILAAGCMLAERTMGAHSVLQDPKPEANPDSHKV